MKNYISLPILLILLISCNKFENNSKIVMLTDGFADSTKIYLYNMENETKDSGLIISNKIVFSAEVTEPTYFCINNEYKTREDFQYRYFWKENNNLTIRVENGDLRDAKFEGSKIQRIVDLLDASKAILNRKRDSLLKKFRAMPRELEEKRSVLRTEGKKIEKAIIATDINYIRNNPRELYSAIALKNLMLNTIPKELTKELYDNLSPEIQTTKYGVIVRKFLELSKEVKIGDKAIDFQLPDLDNQIVSLSNFKGKYVLLDFWSSNCGPCRIENPNLLKNYKAYRNKGFEIVGISLDKKIETWKSTVKADSMIWTTVSDLKGFDGDLSMTYSLYYIPTYYLINPEGVIIDKIMGRGQLDGKLKAIFDK